MKVTKKTVDQYLEGSSFATFATNGVCGVYRKDAGPAHSFRNLGKTWREVYIALLIGEGTASADEKLRALGVEL